MRSDVELAEMAAKKYAARSGGRCDWAELVGVAWEGIARRAESRARRGLPPMTESQRYMGAYSELVDEARRGSGGFGATRYRDTPLLCRLSDLDDDAQDWLPELADRPAFVVVPAVGHRRRGPYAPHEVAAIRAAVRRGATAAEIAAGLGRPVYSVLHQFIRLRLRVGSGRKVDLVRRSELVAHLGAGLSVRQTAKRLGMGYTTTRHKIHLAVRDGVLVRTGGNSTACRYVPAKGGLA